MSRTGAFVTNLELRESNPDGTEAAGLSHKAEGMFLLHVLEVAGVGEPRGTITVLHGAGDHGGRYEDLAHTLASTGWAIALPDLRGHGKSEGPRGHSWGLPEVLRDVEAVQDHLAYRLPDAPRILLGQGLGAIYAAAYALAHPGALAALVLAAPTFQGRWTPPQKPGGLKGLFKKLQPTSPGSLGHRPELLTSDPGARSALAADELVHDAISLHTSQHLPAVFAEVERRFGELSLPILLLQGEADSLADPARTKRLAEGRSNVTLRTYPGKLHDLFHEQGADELAASVRDWIAELG